MWTTVIEEGAITNLLPFLRDSKFQQAGRSGEYNYNYNDKSHESQPQAKEEIGVLDTACDLSNEVRFAS